jgi:adenylyltransferase/sulfurtransferase
VGGLSEPQIRRYSRQILLREVGGRGQSRLLSSGVVLCGLGPIGATSAAYLGAAGVGTLWLCDTRPVSVDDLGAGALFATSDLGATRAEVAAREIARRNPDAHCLCTEPAPTQAPLLWLFCGELLANASTKDATAQPQTSNEAAFAGERLQENALWLRAGITDGEARLSTGCGAFLADALHEGAGALGVALAASLGALAAQEALRLLLGSPCAPGTLFRYELEEPSFQRKT